MSIYFSANDSPRSAYIHIPFCRHRCGYCNFALVAGRDRLIEPFLDAIETQIRSLEKHYELDTLFYGGGTPSHLNSDQLSRLGDIVATKFSLHPNAEVTAECNPADIEPQSLSSLQSIGVNRISLGVQSFRSEKLKTLQRDHDGAIAKTAFLRAKEQIGNVSMDLIFAAPDETLSHWKADLETALSLQPTHLSTYELTYEKGTNFWTRKLKGELNEAEEELRAKMYQAAIDRCTSAGLEQYEVSSFATAGNRCRHNMVYWYGNPWFAFGPGSAGFANGKRETNHASTTTWMKRIANGDSPIDSVEHIDVREHALERLIFGLRMVDGIDVKAFNDASQYSVEELAGAKLRELASLELLVVGERIRLTRQGRMVADWVSGELFG